MPKDNPSAYTKHVARIASETVEISHRLRRKYPQMYKSGWGKTKKKPGMLKRIGSALRRKKRTKPHVTQGTSRVQQGLAAAGITSKQMPSDVAKRKLRRKK